MAAESICDGCGERRPMTVGCNGEWHKPLDWYERIEIVNRTAKIQTACSRKCIRDIAEKTGKTSVVAPW